MSGNSKNTSGVHNSGVDNIGLGITAVCFAVFLGSVADASAKWFGTQGYLATQVVFLRYVFGLIPVVFFVYRSGAGALYTKRYGMHIVRSFLGFCSILSFFWGITMMPLAEAIAISFTAPLFTTALSVPMLGERVGPRRWAAVGIGFLGALVIIQPGTDAFQPVALVLTLSAFLYACMLNLTRRLSATETNVAMFTYTTIIAGLLSAPLLVLGWQTPSDIHWLMFSGFGIVEGLASFLLIIAYRNMPAAVGAPFDYTSLVWATLFGWLLWQDTPGMIVLVGSSIIILSGIYIARREALSRLN